MAEIPVLWIRLDGELSLPFDAELGEKFSASVELTYDTIRSSYAEGELTLEAEVTAVISDVHRA